MKYGSFILLFLMMPFTFLNAQSKKASKALSYAPVTISRDVLMDKIKGGWAGQTIGVTFGGVTEFRYNGTFIQDYQPIDWYDGYLKKQMEKSPDLYDDIYMDLTFVDVLEKHGFDAPVDSFANAFAHAGYNLWHANEAARYNILQGIKAPESGQWQNNPHADDIDFQIEADFTGLMSPGMPNAAIGIGDKVGHIMNYGDGWYGGVYVGAMYSLAFLSDDINKIVEEALTAIPAKSSFYQCLSDVIRWHKQYPADWKRTWFEVQKKWSSEVGCPEGVFVPFDIDAKINAAYIVIGLLYGNGDYTKTLEIATRCGQDSDCNPSSVGGILGAMIGYDKIPAYWKMGLKEVEDLDFKYTSMSLNKVYATSFKHALVMIEKNGGKVSDREVTIRPQKPATVRYEQCFEGLVPVERRELRNLNHNELEFEFTGTAFALRGDAVRKSPEQPEYVFEADMFIDGQKIETAQLPTSYRLRRYELFWKYGLANKKHTVKIVVKNPSPDYLFRPADLVVYSDHAMPHHASGSE